VSRNLFLKKCLGICCWKSVLESVFKKVSGNVFLKKFLGICFWKGVWESVSIKVSGNLFLKKCLGICFWKSVRESVFEKVFGLSVIFPSINITQLIQHFCVWSMLMFSLLFKWKFGKVYNVEDCYPLLRKLLYLYYYNNNCIANNILLLFISVLICWCTMFIHIKQVLKGYWLDFLEMLPM